MHARTHARTHTRRHTRAYAHARRHAHTQMAILPTFVIAPRVTLAVLLLRQLYTVDETCTHSQTHTQTHEHIHLHMHRYIRTLAHPSQADRYPYMYAHRRILAHVHAYTCTGTQRQASQASTDIHIHIPHSLEERFPATFYLSGDWRVETVVDMNIHTSTHGTFTHARTRSSIFLAVCSRICGKWRDS